jgi:Protein of unknown function (DUF2950)
MKTLNRLHSFSSMLTALFVVTVCVLLSSQLRADEQPAAARQRQFATSEEATKALLEAARAKDKAALREIFGPGIHDILTGDEVQDAANFEAFTKAMGKICNPVHEGNDKVILNIGAENWPFPIPLVKKDGQWFFDTGAGKEEIINRHIGEGEINAISVCRAYVQAQRQYAGQDRDGSGVLKYAQKFKSAPGRKDGLYWESAPGEEPSPFGPLVAEAHAEGYGQKPKGAGHQPFHGYFFKILTAQGPAAPGGKYNFIINDNMIAGFALVAYPAHWGQSGIMTFIVNQQGKVYQRNLDEKTAEIASAMTRYNPDGTWTLVQEPGAVVK